MNNKGVQECALLYPTTLPNSATR